MLGSRYEILELLGQGGMGAVYKAKDLELDRVVALKAIRPELAAQPELLQRFKQELILARQITHKNIIRIFDLGEADGTKFITMEYIKGRDLKALLVEKGKLSIRESVRVIEQVCLALEAAHAEGVVHRDLKPQNIMVDDSGKICVMDFGIARSVEVGGMTQTGALLGTPEYMSPEQVKGEHVDVRSDIFTLGIIFYELLTGQMPFKAETVQAAMFKRTQERPRPPAHVNAEVPRFLSELAAKCLEMDPQLRYQTAREVLNDLHAWQEGASTGAVFGTRWLRRAPQAWKKWSGVAAALLILSLMGFIVRERLARQPPEKSGPVPVAVSLAIVPFRNASGDKTIDWLGASMAEMLSADVGQSPHLRTVSPERVAQVLRDLRILPDTALDAPTIRRVAEFSNSDTVVWGQYARFGDQFRMDATIEDLKHGHTTTLKAEAGGEKDIPAAIDRLAGDIRQNLAVSHSVVKELEAQSFKLSSASLPALRAYHEGLQLERMGNHLEAAKRFEASTKEDPQFALAYSQLARTYASLGHDDEAEQFSRKAMELSEKLPAAEQYLIAAIHQRILRDYPKAVESYEALARVSPDNVDVLFDLGSLYESSGAYEKARERYKKLLELDPKQVHALSAMGRAEIESGNAQGAFEYLNRAQTIAIELGNDEEKADILQTMGVAYSVLNKPEDALGGFQDALTIRRRLGLKHGIANSLESIAQMQDVLGKSEAALKNYNESLQLRREIGDKAGTGDVLNDLAQFYDDRGQYDRALKLFKESLPIQVEAGNESNQALVLNNIGNTYLFKGDYEDARTYFERSLQLREKLKIPSYIADTLHNLAETSVKMGQYDQALSQYMRALDLRRSVGDKRTAAIESSSMGTLFGYQGRYGAALSAQEDALKTFRETQERGFWLSQILGDYGYAQAQLGKFTEAEKTLTEALSLARELNNQAQIAQVLNDQADESFLRGDYKSAAPVYERAVQAASHTSDRNLILLSKMNLAKLAVKQGRFQTAAGTLRGLSEEADTAGLKYLSVQCSVYLGEALIGMKDYSRAQQELQRTISRSEKLGLHTQLAQSHYLFGRALELTGNAKEAAVHYSEAQHILDDIRKEAHSDSVLQRSDLSPISAQAPR